MEQTFPWWPIDLIAASFRYSGSCVAPTPVVPVKEFISMKMTSQPPTLAFLLNNPSTGLTPISQALCLGVSVGSKNPFIIHQHDTSVTHTSAHRNIWV